MATKQIIGYYQKQPIYAGSDAEVASQMAAIDRTKSGVVTPPAVTTPVANPPKTQAELDSLYNTAAASHPVLKSNTPEALNYAASTGDYTALVNASGKPFSAADQAEAVATATAALDPYYRAMETKDTQDTEAALADKKRGYDEYLATQGENFQTDKTTLDQNAADRGVLFSGGRYQKEKSLQDAYARAGESKRASVGSDIASTARNFGYNYGDSATNNLSQYFNLGRNTYNAGVATGGVNTGGISSIYNANQGFQGTQKNTAKSEIQKRAAGLLYNKGNKLLSTGYLNQY